MKIIFGFVLCILLITVIAVIFAKTFEAQKLILVQETVSNLLKDSITISKQSKINITTVAAENLDEKISALNKRFDDFYLSGGFIVALLVTINIGIFIKAEMDSKKNFEDKFESHLQIVINYEKKAAELLGKIDAYYNSIESRQNVANEIQEPA